MAETWDAMKAVGRDDTATDRINKQTRKLVEAEDALKYARTDRAKAAARADVEEAKAAIAQLQRAQKAAAAGARLPVRVPSNAGLLRPTQSCATRI